MAHLLSYAKNRFVKQPLQIHRYVAAATKRSKYAGLTILADIWADIMTVILEDKLISGLADVLELEGRKAD
jgi:hypothetical protein